MNDFVIECENLSKSFFEGGLHVDVFKSINLQVPAKARIAILGTSGAGKSTLLHLLGGLDKPTSGRVLLCGNDLSHSSEKKRSILRNKYLGFVYQFHHLLPEFSALENVAMPLLIAGYKKNIAYDKAMTLIEKVGLSARYNHKPAELSGGEKQRIAIVRAMVTEPSCILADEPTGNLDNKTASQVYETLLTLNEVMQTSLVIVTHDKQLANNMQQCFHLQDGKLVPDNETVTLV